MGQEYILGTVPISIYFFSALFFNGNPITRSLFGLFEVIRWLDKLYSESTNRGIFIHGVIFYHLFVIHGHVIIYRIY